MLWYWLSKNRKVVAVMTFLNEYSDIDYNDDLVNEIIKLIDEYEKN